MLFTGKNLSISQEEVESNVSRSQDFTIPCQITQQSSMESKFQVTWFFQEDTKTKEKPIFRANRDSTLQMFGRDDQLRFSHPLPKQFNLTVLKPGLENSGIYFCEVEEWIPSLSHGWKRVAVERSGYFTVNYAEGKHTLGFVDSFFLSPANISSYHVKTCMCAQKVMRLFFFFRRC